MLTFLLNQSSRRSKASQARKLSTFCLLVGLSTSGCDADMLGLLDDVLQDQCPSNLGCSQPSASTTGIEHTTTSSDNVDTSAASQATAASTHIDDTAMSTKVDVTGAENSDDCTDNQDPAQDACEDGATRERPCSYCGTQAQICQGGTWNDDGACTGQAENYPGEIRWTESRGRFECGVHRNLWTYDEQCKPVDYEGPGVYVSYCAPTECCGFGSTVPPSCLDPDNLPGDARCAQGPPEPESIGKTWMTPQMWDEYYASIQTPAPAK